MGEQRHNAYYGVAALTGGAALLLFSTDTPVRESYVSAPAHIGALTLLIAALVLFALTATDRMPGLRQSARLVIIRATWGTDETSYDVTATIAARVGENRLDFPVDYRLLGPDPAPRIGKRLTIEYRYGNGPVRSLIVNEQENPINLVLPQPSDIVSGKAKGVPVALPAAFPAPRLPATDAAQLVRRRILEGERIRDFVAQTFDPARSGERAWAWRVATFEDLQRCPAEFSAPFGSTRDDSDPHFPAPNRTDQEVVLRHLDAWLNRLRGVIGIDPVLHPGDAGYEG